VGRSWQWAFKKCNVMLMYYIFIKLASFLHHARCSPETMEPSQAFSFFHVVHGGASVWVLHGNFSTHTLSLSFCRKCTMPSLVQRTDFWLQLWYKWRGGMMHGAQFSRVTFSQGNPLPMPHCWIHKIVECVLKC